MMNKLMTLWALTTESLDKIGEFFPQLVLRVILAWEFGEAGFAKLNGENWFANIQDNFPFPFSVVPVDISWFIATWSEVLGAFAILFGLATRFFSFSLIILTVVAILSVHWPESYNGFGELLKGYSISNNGFGNYKLPLILLVMLLPLLFSGPGKLSLDYFIKKYFTRGSIM